MMTPFDYNYQSPSGFACPMLIRPIVSLPHLECKILKEKRKTNWIVVVVVKRRRRGSCLWGENTL